MTWDQVRGVEQLKPVGYASWKQADDELCLCTTRLHVTTNQTVDVNCTCSVDEARAHSNQCYCEASRNSTYLTAFRPAATIFWNMSSHRSGTGRRKVWNSPELGADLISQ